MSPDRDVGRQYYLVLSPKISVMLRFLQEPGCAWCVWDVLRAEGFLLLSFLPACVYLVHVKTSVLL